MTNPEDLPILYSFRRCPYAMRARMALSYSRQRVQLREVLLRAKPVSMLAYSAKGTVPVLVLNHLFSSGTRVIDESLDIMIWAVQRQDPDGWWPTDKRQQTEVMRLIAENDHQFKPHLDQYKYADRYPEHPADHYRSEGLKFIHQLERRLNHHDYLLGPGPSLADIAIFPFVRQYAGVDQSWFDQLLCRKVQLWLKKPHRIALVFGCNG
jgi:glutathione S-transferase